MFYIIKTINTNTNSQKNIKQRKKTIQHETAYLYYKT